MDLSLAFIALGSGELASAADIQRELSAAWPALPPMTDVHETEENMLFNLGKSQAIVALMPAPIPWSDLEGPCATCTFWPEAAEVLSIHTHHLIVTVGSEDPPLERAKLLTQLVTALLAASESALGVYWGDATLVIPPEMFRDFATELLPDGLPLLLWVDFRVGRAEEGGSRGFTTGLAKLGHMEVEVLSSPEKPKQLWERLTGLVGYLLENGPVVKDGNTIGSDENEKIRVVYADSTFGHECQVMRLEYGPPDPAPPKARWKFWSRN